MGRSSQQFVDTPTAPKLEFGTPLAASSTASSSRGQDAIKAYPPPAVLCSHAKCSNSALCASKLDIDQLAAARYGGYPACKVEGLELPMLKQPRAIMTAASQGKLLGRGTCGSVQKVCIGGADAALKHVPARHCNILTFCLAPAPAMHASIARGTLTLVHKQQLSRLWALLQSC